MKNLVVFIILMVSVPCFGATYYCDLTLSGDGAGTSGDPWQWSQAEATGNVSDDDIVNLRGTGGAITLTTNSDANGSAGSPVVYQQWSGQTQAQFTSITIDGTTTPFYTFDGIKIDAGTGTTWVTAFTESWSGTGSGELTFQNCTIWGFRPTSYSGGDYYPYYIGDSSSTWQNIYAMNFNTVDGLTLVINGCTFQHGWRVFRLTQLTNSTVTITVNTFDRAGEDFINVSGSDNVTMSLNSFSLTSPLSHYYAVWFWPGAATGTWAGHEGEAITQATTNASGLYVGQNGGNIFLVVDDSGNLPVRTNQQVWSLDSDSSNIFFTPSGNGDNAHNDHISVDGDSDNNTISRNLFNGSTGSRGQALKIDNAGIQSAIIQNNIIKQWNGGTYSLLINAVNDIDVVNNVFDVLSNDLHGIRTIAGTDILIANNILTGAVDSGGTVTSVYNVFKSAADPWDGSDNLLSQDIDDSPSGNNRYFTSYTTGDYTPYDGSSPQVDAGSATYAPADDYVGTSRPQNSTDDIGAYEYIWGNMRGAQCTGCTIQ